MFLSGVESGVRHLSSLTWLSACTPNPSPGRELPGELEGRRARGLSRGFPSPGLPGSQALPCGTCPSVPGADGAVSRRGGGGGEDGAAGAPGPPPISTPSTCPCMRGDPSRL